MSFPEGSKVWSKLVLIASLICVFSVFVAIFGVRLGAFNFRVASDMLESTLQAAIPVLLVAVIIFVGEAETRIKTGAAIVILLFPIIGIWVNQPPAPSLNEQGQRLAALNDISTDTQNPPQFEAVMSMRPATSNSVIFPENGAKIQAERFADIQPIRSDLTRKEAYENALTLVDQYGWELVLADESQGRIEAVASTFFFNFKDDVVIRIRSEQKMSIIDIRSHSRLGKGDRGKNAERVRAFIRDFNQVAKEE